MPIFVDLVNKTKMRLPAEHFFVSATEETLRGVASLSPDTAKSLQTVFRKKVELSFIFVSRNEIRRLNRKYRGKNKPTDVLSFPNFSLFAKVRASLVRENPCRLGKILPMADPDGVVRLGEIMVAPEVAQAEAALFEHTIREHYVFLFVHGLLHLLEYDHEKSRRDGKIMQRIQKGVLKEFQN